LFIISHSFIKNLLFSNFYYKKNIKEEENDKKNYKYLDNNFDCLQNIKSSKVIYVRKDCKELIYGRGEIKNNIEMIIYLIGLSFVVFFMV